MGSAFQDKKRVLVPLAPGFEEVEALTPVDVLRRAGCHVVTASVGVANPVVGRNRIRVMADIDLEEAVAEWGDDWDLVILPGGGPGVENLERSQVLLDLLRRRLEAQRPVAAICAAPRILSRAGVDRALPITGHPACRQDLADHTDYREEPVVRAGAVITSRGPATALAFALACAEALCGPEVAAKLRQDLVA